jgi:hypothetical protein
MSDPIKAALVAATRAFQALDGHDPEYDDTPKVAAAIAAFLRALPDDYMLADHYSRPTVYARFRDFANAVEWVARHE